MGRSRLLAAAALAFALNPLHAALPALDSQGEPLPTLAPMLDRSVPAVVNVFTTTRVPVRQHPLFADPFFRRFFDLPEAPRERRAQSLGSGVIVDAENGYVLTNAHVVDRAVEIAVNLHDGRTLQAELVGTDPEADVAVIKVPAEELSALPLADSDALRVGDFVVAIGNPFGLGQTVTSGIVSALSRSGLGIEGYEDFIQTDASINPGNSGGALVNLRGELVGINTAILSEGGGNVGIGFAIPVNMARDIMRQLVEHGEVRRGVLGVQAQDLTPELAAAFDIRQRRGAVVTRVEPDSAADNAGLRAGDVIVEANGRPVREADDVRNIVGLRRVGETVELKVVRAGEVRRIEATIEEPELTTLEGEKLHPQLAGATFGELAENGAAAVVVLDVAPGSRAQRNGLRKGDVIVSTNRREVRALGDFAEQVRGHRRLLFNIHRGGRALFMLVE